MTKSLNKNFYIYWKCYKKIYIVYDLRKTFYK